MDDRGNGHVDDPVQGPADLDVPGHRRQRLTLRPEEVEQVRQIGDNTGCMILKGASKRHATHGDRADEWPMRPELLEIAGRYGLGEEW